MSDRGKTTANPDGFARILTKSGQKYALQNRIRIYSRLPKFFKKIIEKIKYYYSGIHSQSEEGRIVSEWKDSLNERLQLFIDGVNAAARNLSNKENSTNDGGVKNQFRVTESGMANDKLSKYSDELIDIFEARGDIVVSNYDTLVETVNRAFDEPDIKATVYFGILSADELNTIEKKVPNIPKEFNGKVFPANRDFSIAATFDSIRHIVDEKPSLTRQDVIDYLDRLPDTIIDNDSVSFEYYTDSLGKKNSALLFKKKFSDGTIETLDLVSKGRRSLKLQTIYMEKGDYIKKKSAETLLLNKSVAHTPEAGVGQTSTNIISDSTENSNTQNRKNQSRSDSDYLAAVNRGDMETAQKMVDEAAKAAGYTIKAYHGTENDFTVFERGHNRKNYPVGKNMGEGHYFSADKSDAEIYANGKKDGVISSYLSIKNPFKLYGTQFDKSDLQALSKEAGREITKLNVGDYLQEKGYDGIINLEYSGDVRAYLVYDSSQVKSADPVTYDDSGKVIPLSERFNTEKTDIRYQPRTDADLFGDMAWLDQDDDVSLLTHHFENNNEAIGEVLKKTASIEIADRTLKSKIRSVLTKYGVSDSAVNGVFDEVKNILDLSAQGVEFETDETLNNITGIIS